ncbi:hypothetical protein GYH30_034943 [Glycine max]|uniref:ATP-dependent DNA helicase n=1 Tax=Glycine max TaxID=3847 RepID=A0A0R0GHI5_SOYBN|nr:hypothetical protein GYH30_034943 [Glycine max]
MEVVMPDNGGFFFFIYEYGGTRKTFIWNALSATIEVEGFIVLNVALSGIASLLLPGGRTTHYVFSIPLLIIWDEAPMMNKLYFEALDRTLRHIMRTKNSNSSEQPFEGKVVVLGGDVRHILPVIPKGSIQYIISIAVNSSYLWKFCELLKLTQNEFADWISELGDGLVIRNDNAESNVEIPHDLLIHEYENPILHFINFAYLDLLNKFSYLTFFRESFISSLIPGEEREYLSSREWFTPEFLNDIRSFGLPNHRLTLKIGVPIMLLRNIDPRGDLCYGTQLIVNEMGRNIIGATILTGTKSQSFSQVGLFLSRPVFTHGLLYVLVYRVKSRR